MRRKLGIVGIVLGVVALTAAALVHWVLVPRLAQLPGNFSTLRIYTGTAAMVANPTTLTGVTVGPGILRNVPIEVRHSDRVLKTHGSEALVADGRSVSIPGYKVADLVYWVDVNRKTFMGAHHYLDAVNGTGVVFNWPMDTKPHDYLAWVPDTGQTVTARYAGTEKRGGIDTYIYKVTVPETRITDPQLLGSLPSSVTKKQLLETTPSLQFPTKKLLKLDALLAKLPDPVPVAYTYQTVSTFWVAPTSGVVVDLRAHEVRTMNFVDGTRLVPSAPIMDMTYTSPPATLQAAVADAKDTAKQLKLLRSTLPVTALIGGLLFLLVGTALLLSGHKFRPTLGDEELAEVLLEDNVRVPTRVD